MGNKVKIFREETPSRKIKIESAFPKKNIIKIEKHEKEFLQVGKTIFKLGSLYYVDRTDNYMNHAYILTDIYWDDKANAWFLSLGRGEHEYNANYAVDVLTEEIYREEYTRCHCEFACNGYILVDHPYGMGRDQE